MSSTKPAASPRTTGDLRGTVLNVQRMSTEDGPGIRTTVFFKGCPLSCKWCHNPESISFSPEPTLHKSRCIGCGSCLQACAAGALKARREDGSIERSTSLCTACGACAKSCPTGAHELLGEPWTVPALVKEVARDQAYFRDGGGVTASGGEPAAQADFVEAFLKGCRERGLHTALDTSGQCPPGVLRRLLAVSDLVLYDLKVACTKLHAELTGHGNERVFENLSLVRHAIESGEGPASSWIRTPLIPGATATTENISAIGALLHNRLADSVDRWELCSFNELCIEKYERAGRTWPYAGAQRLSSDDEERILDAARSSGVSPDIVHLTGGSKR